MFKNYFKTAWRNLRKHKLVSSINLLGLTVGLTCCLLILVYILNELSYDRYNKDSDRIYRITRTFYNGNGDATLKLATISPPFGYYLPSEFPEIQKMTRLLNAGTLPLKYKEKLINEKNVYFGDENIFDVFTIKVLKGNAATALKEPFSIMMSEEEAKKYFGSEDPINKVIKANNQFDLKVTGVYQSFPSNSHMHPGLLISFNTLNDSLVYGEKNLRTNWGNNSFFTYIKLPPHYNAQNMINRFPAFLDNHMASEYGDKKPSKFTSIDLQKLTDIHLYSHTDYEAENNGDIKIVYIFSIIAFFILLIACINYINLSTARSALRGKEIGIRKVVGARKNELMLQFISEAIITTLLATLISLILLTALLPFLNKVSGENLSERILFNWKITGIGIFVVFAIGALSGLYPALVLSSFKPVQTLKGFFKIKSGGVTFRKVLVTLQFAISIILIIATTIVFQQLHYLKNASLGYDKEQIITMPYFGQQSNGYESFRNTILQNANIKSVTRSSRIPTGRLLDNMGASTIGSNSAMEPVKADIRYVAVDYDFIPSFGIKMKAGRNFSREFSSDTSNFVINETAARAIGWKSSADALDKPLMYGDVSGHIIGVMQDFHFESMHQSISPMILILPSTSRANALYNNISFKLGSGNISNEIASVRKAWQEYFPELPFEYTFLDENYAQQYQKEQKQEAIFSAFAFIAIFIASLGLLGLSTFAISQRIKEIGIRKVLGASVSGIVTLLSKDFLLLVLLASIIALPVAWYAVSQWLNSFAYRIDISIWVFAISILIALFIAFVTISFQAIKAAMANPVKSLRTE